MLLNSWFDFTRYVLRPFVHATLRLSLFTLQYFSLMSNTHVAVHFCHVTAESFLFDKLSEANFAFNCAVVEVVGGTAFVLFHLLFFDEFLCGFYSGGIHITNTLSLLALEYNWL